MTQGHIHSFETFGSVDGPGVRFVVFVQGCRMRCRYCHNPDTWKIGEGELWNAEDIMNKALRYKPYWGNEGGVTVSGGEPLLQIEFVTELFELLKKNGINTCLDTAGGPFNDDPEWLAAFDRLMKSTDLVMLDIKQSRTRTSSSVQGTWTGSGPRCGSGTCWFRAILTATSSSTGSMSLSASSGT